MNLKSTSNLTKSPLEFDREGGFYVEDEISEFNKRVFGLTKLENSILKEIASKGPLVGNQIIKSVSKSLKTSEDKVRYSLYHNKNDKNLTKLKFLTKRKGQAVGNFKNRENKRHVTKYSLTLKGFLASLSFTTFETHYMVIKFKKFIETYYSFMPWLSEFAVVGIKYDIALFLFDQYRKHINLKESNSIQLLISEFHISDNYDSSPFLDLELNVQDRKIFQKIIDRHWLITILLNNVEKRLEHEKPENITGLGPINAWHEYIEYIQKYSKFTLHLREYWDFDDEPNDTISVDEKSISAKAHEILKNYGINENVDSNIFWR